jgi:hypothetical protein
LPFHGANAGSNPAGDAKSTPYQGFTRAKSIISTELKLLGDLALSEAWQICSAMPTYQYQSGPAAAAFLNAA